MGLSPVTVSKRPARLSGAIGVVGAAIALALVVDVAAARGPIVIELAGLLVASVGVGAATRGYRVVGFGTVVAGVALALASIPLVALTIGEVSVALALLTGVVGIFTTSMGLFPVRGNGSRALVRLGTALVFLAVLAAALFRLGPPDRLLAGAVLTVVAWDAGDNAIGIGAQLGTRASTTRAELVHVAGSVVVGIVAMLAAAVVGGISVPGFSLESFVLLLGAVVLLTLSLHG